MAIIRRETPIHSPQPSRKLLAAPLNACAACVARARRPLAFGLPVDVRWEWSEVRWGHDKRSSLDFERNTGLTRHVFHEGHEFPACAPWWDNGFIAPADVPARESRSR